MSISFIILAVRGPGEHLSADQIGEINKRHQAERFSTDPYIEVVEAGSVDWLDGHRPGPQDQVLEANSTVQWFCPDYTKGIWPNALAEFDWVRRHVGGRLYVGPDSECFVMPLDDEFVADCDRAWDVVVQEERYVDNN